VSESLRELVRAACAETPDPREVWSKVRAQLDDETVWDAVDVMGPDYCRNLAGSMRTAALSNSPGRLTKTSTPKARAAYEDQWRKALATSIPLSEDGSAAKFLGECTMPDLLAAAAIRRKNEARNRIWAERFEGLAQKMKAHRATSVSMLAPEVFFEVMS
jgi:hypothetical protein